MDLGIAGRVAIVTGASKGIGRATAEALVGEGVAVVLAAREQGPLTATTEALASGGAKVASAAVDVMDPTSSEVLRDLALERFGRIDMVVNVAGGGTDVRLRDFDEDRWLDIYRLNVVSAMRLTHACLPTLVAQRWGRVVMVGSTAGRDADARFAPYGAAKAALHHLTKNLALAYGKDGVLTNCVIPGLIRSDATLTGYEAAAAATGRTTEQIEQRMLELQPIALGRTGQPAEIGGVIAFLCSEPASFVNGALLLVDGGTIKAVP